MRGHTAFCLLPDCLASDCTNEKRHTVKSSPCAVQIFDGRQEDY